MFSTMLSTKLIGPLRTDSSDSDKANSQGSKLLNRESFPSFPGGGGGQEAGSRGEGYNFTRPLLGLPYCPKHTSVPCQRHGSLLPAGL